MPEQVAVIFVPGIFASHLVKKGRGIAWPINSNKMGLHLTNYNPTKKREIMAGANTFEVAGSFDSPKKSWDSVYKKIYQPFLEDCHHNTSISFDPVVWGAGYNFTQSNEKSAGQVWKVIESALKALPPSRNRKYLLITHSMGALPTRYLLNSQRRRRKACIGVIHVVAPNGGSPEFIMRYFRGLPKAGEAGGSANPTRIILGKKGWRVATTASAIQGAYELFPFADPTVARRDQSGGPAPNPSDPTDPFFLNQIVDFVFSDKNAQANHDRLHRDWRSHFEAAVGKLGNIHTDINRFNRTAQGFHRSLGSYMFERTAAVCLIGKKTVQGVKYRFDNKGDLLHISQEENVNGDGTVPLWSQKKFMDTVSIRSLGLQLKGDNLVSIVDKGLDHSEPFTEEGREAGVFEEIYGFMNLLYGAYRE